MELREPIFLREIGVPQFDNLVDIELPDQVATHPPISKVHEVYIQLVQMIITCWI